MAGQQRQHQCQPQTVQHLTSHFTATSRRKGVTKKSAPTTTKSATHPHKQYNSKKQAGHQQTPKMTTTSHPHNRSSQSMTKHIAPTVVNSRTARRHAKHEHPPQIYIYLAQEETCDGSKDDERDALLRGILVERVHVVRDLVESQGRNELRERPDERGRCLLCVAAPHKKKQGTEANTCTWQTSKNTRAQT